MKSKIDNSQSVRFKVEVKSLPTPSKGILEDYPKLKELHREKIKRSKKVTSDNSKVEKGELQLRIVSELQHASENEEKKGKEIERSEEKKV